MTNTAHVNGVRKEWRDTTAAHLALLEPEKLEQRRAIAERMMRKGARCADIRAATKAETGTAIGAGTLSRIRREIEREAKREERRAAREAAGKVRRMKPPPIPSKADAPLTPPGWVQLPGDIAVITALVAAGAPFVFDGKRVSMKAGK